MTSRKTALMVLALVSLLITGVDAVDAQLPSNVVPNGLGVEIHFLANQSQDLDMIQASAAEFCPNGSALEFGRNDAGSVQLCGQ